MAVARTLPAKPSEKPDTKIHGLYVRTWPSGKRSAAIRYVVEGRQRRLSLGVLSDAFTLEQARTKAKRALGGVANGGDPSRDRKAARAAETFGDVAKRWLTDYVDVETKRRTPKTYRDLVRLHLAPALGAEKIARITIDDVEAARDAIRKGAGKGAANRAIRVASAIFTWARVEPNPCRGLKPFKEPSRAPGGVAHVYSPAELAKIDDALDTAAMCAAGDELYLSPSVVAALRLLMLTGARLSEICGLKWAEVKGAELHLTDTKAGKSVRPLRPSAVALLAALKDKRGTSPFVCPTSAGTPIHPRNLGRAWHSLRQRTGVCGRLHDLRHTAGSMALAAGVPLPNVSKMLGHRDVATTARVYSHPLNETAEMAKFDDAFEAAIERGRSENSSARVVALPKRKAARA